MQRVQCPGSGPAALRTAETRHGRYFAGQDEQAATTKQGVELDNFVSACHKAIDREDAGMAAKLLEHAWACLTLRGPFRAGIELALAVRAMPGLQAVALTVVERVLGRALGHFGRSREAYPHFEASLAAAKDAADQRSECHALLGLGSFNTHASRPELAHSQLDAALATARAAGDRRLQSSVRNGLGNLELSLSHWAEARSHFEAALALAREVGARRMEGGVLGNLANLHSEAGEMDQARICNEAALALAQELGDRRLEGNTLSNLGLGNQVQGNLETALGQLVASLAVARDLGHVELECIVLCNLGMVFEALARADEALEHFEAAIVIARQIGDQHGEGQFLGYLGLLHARQARPGEARACLLAGEARLRTTVDQPSLAILLCARAEAEQLAGDNMIGRALLAQAQEIASEIGAGKKSELGLTLTRVSDLLGLPRI